MQVTREQVNPTTIKLTINADAETLRLSKESVLKQLARKMKLSGFRPGKAPLGLVEKNTEPAVLQSEVIEEAFGRLYEQAVKQEDLRIIGQPKVTLRKFVPFTDLEFDAEIEVVSDITLPDYTKFKLAKETLNVTDKDIEEVVDNLLLRVAEKKEVERPAAAGDEVVIDFTGVDAKTGEAISGAEGKGYPLTLGSDTFIPGFEANLLGLKAGEEKTFTITFPKDYGVKALQNRKVAFTVTATKVHEIAKPAADDAFAAKVGPFKTVEALRADIRTQLETEKAREANRIFENKLLEMLADKTTVAIPETLIEQEIDRDIQQTRQNLTYRGQTWQEYLAELGESEEDHRKAARPMAEKRVKIGLAMSEVAEREKLTVTPEEFQIRMQLLKGQYQDKMMQAELEKAENARSIISALLSEKTVAKLVEYATTKA